METAKCPQCGETYPVETGCVTCRLAGKEAPKEEPREDADTDKE